MTRLPPEEVLRRVKIAASAFTQDSNLALMLLMLDERIQSQDSEIKKLQAEVAELRAALQAGR
jgi:hypothetical protein